MNDTARPARERPDSVTEAMPQRLAEAAARSPQTGEASRGRWRWQWLRLEQKFLVIATLAIGLSMGALGYLAERHMRAAWIQGLAESGALYLEGFLAPHVQDLEGAQALPPERQSAIENLLLTTSLGKRVAIIKIWDLAGNLIFSTSKGDSHSKLHAGFKQRITAGQVVVDDNVDDHLNEIGPVRQNVKLIEIYAPIYKQNSNKIIAIGEFYEYDYFIKKQINELRFTMWKYIIVSFLLITLFLYGSVRKISSIITAQQNLLEANLARAGALARRNNALRRAAHRMRLNAILLNESYLASIGSDIHDGPIQVLSLMMLKLPAAGQGGEKGSILRKDLEPLIQQTLSDLRNLSAGLALPEAANLSTQATIELAITRHEQHTGTTVEKDISVAAAHVPGALRLCAYRVVQEALNNAYKHANGNRQAVHVRQVEDTLDILVTDGGPLTSGAVKGESGSGLGLRGMENRVKSLRGTLAIYQIEHGGTAVHVTLPLRN